MMNVITIIGWIAQGVELITQAIREDPKLQTIHVAEEIAKLRTSLAFLDDMEAGEWKEVGGE